MSAPYGEGGQAFPSDTRSGMYLRDWFAANASDDDIAEIIGVEREIGTPAITRQQARYIHADAMLAERAKGAA